jgi:hypothetical protein
MSVHGRVEAARFFYVVLRKSGFKFVCVGPKVFEKKPDNSPAMQQQNLAPEGAF